MTFDEHAETSSTCCVDSRIRQRYFVSWILDRTVDTELLVTPMIHGSTFELHESSPIVLGVCEGYDTYHLLSR